MSQHLLHLRLLIRRTVAAILTGLCLLGGSLHAAEARPVPVGRVLAESGMVVAREAFGKPWRPLEKGQSITADDLLIGMSGATIESKNGAVRVSFLSDLDEKSPFPVLETAVILKQAGKDFDLDLRLDRGRIDLTNEKTKGPARVRLHYADRYWDLTLRQPGARAAVEIYGCFPPGTRFNPDAKKDPSPVTDIVLLALKGNIDRGCPECFFALSAPPGPALYQWDSVNGGDASAHRLDKLPEWATVPDKESPLVKMKREKLSQFRKAMLSGSIESTLKKFLTSEDPNDRRLGMYAAAALDQLHFVGDTLITSKRPDDWQNAVVALRHWLGRGSGQQRLLYDRLIKDRGFTPAEARTVLQMLHGFTELQTSQPLLYSILIDMLRHERLAIRGLAQWHLRRLAPTVKVEFNPAGDKEERERAHAAWKKAIPDGKLPPSLREDRKEKPSRP
jgi:hypothetical protein